MASPIILIPGALAFFIAVFSEGNPYSNSYYHPSEENYQKEKGNMVQYRDGDVLIGGMLRIHHRGENEACSTIRDDGFQALETFNLILDQINNRSDILEKIKLGSVIIDTCSIDTHASKQIVEEILPIISVGDCGGFSNTSSLSPLSGMVGASSSSVSIQTASLLQIFKIPQVSPWSTSRELSNKQRFPYFFRAVPSDTYQILAAVELFDQLGWSYISAVYEDDNYGFNAFNELDSAVKERNICVAKSLRIKRSATIEDYDEVVRQLLQEKKAKVVIIISKTKDAEGVIRAADNNQAARGHFIWVGLDGWAGQLPIDPNDNSYATSLNSSLALQPMRAPVSNLKQHILELSLENYHDNKSADFARNPWFQEYHEKFHDCKFQENSPKLCNRSTNIETDILEKTQNVADSLLALVHSLNHFVNETCSSLNSLSCRKKMKKYSGTSRLAHEVYEILKVEPFIGVHGKKLEFDENHDGLAKYDIVGYHQNKGWTKTGAYTDGLVQLGAILKRFGSMKSSCSEKCKVGEVKSTNKGCCWTCHPCLNNEYVSADNISCTACERDEIPQADRRGCIKISVQQMTISSGEGMGSMLTSVIGILLTVFIAAVYYHNRESPIVKASGLELCICIWIGALLTFFNGIVASIPATNASCLMSRVLMSLGLSLVYAALLVKTVRIVIVFRAKAFLTGPMKKIVRSKVQILLTMALVLIQALIVVMWSLVEVEWSVVRYKMAAAVRLCAHLDTFHVFIGLAYPFVLILSCLVVATLNRKVPEGFNETRVVVFTTYAVVMTWAGMVPIFVATEEKPLIRVTAISICCNLNSVVTLLSLFGVRCYTIVFKPLSNTKARVMERSSHSAHTTGESHIEHQHSIVFSSPSNEGSLVKTSRSRPASETHIQESL